MKYLDDFLNKTTMYRLVLDVLMGLMVIAVIFCFFGILPYSPWALIYSTMVLLIVCWLANAIFSSFLHLPANLESSYITAFILALIITPPAAGQYVSILGFLFWAAVWSMAAKYLLVLNIGNKHLFNPAAFGVAVTALVMHKSASWWIGSTSMQIFILLGGFLIVKKLRRWDSVIAFLAATFTAMIVLTWGQGNVISILISAVKASSLLFFASIMFTEPLTMPPSKDGRIAYGILVGWLFTPQVHFGPVYLSPETALLVGNLFSFIISPKGRHMLRLIEKIKIADGQYDFVFKSDLKKYSFLPGQYLEWTLGQPKPDNRGTRRYFTIASSPTEKNIRLGVKFYNSPSSYKKALFNLRPGDCVAASALAGDFVLPKEADKKLVFIAGGIGITPFRSMLKYLLDTNQRRDITLFFSNKNAGEIVYRDVLEQAGQKFGVKTVYTLTDPGVPPDWNGYPGFINAQMVASEVPDYLERLFYVSGSHAMVTAMKKMLVEMGVARSKIITDFFPGLV